MDKLILFSIVISTAACTLEMRPDPQPALRPVYAQPAPPPQQYVEPPQQQYVEPPPQQQYQDPNQYSQQQYGTSSDVPSYDESSDNGGDYDYDAQAEYVDPPVEEPEPVDRKSTRLNSSHIL